MNREQLNEFYRLRAVHKDNMDSQPDGVSPDVLHDIGYVAPELSDLIPGYSLDSTTQPVEETTSKAGAHVICGDCIQVIPCAHSNGTNTLGY